MQGALSLRYIFINHYCLSFNRETGIFVSTEKDFNLQSTFFLATFDKTVHLHPSSACCQKLYPSTLTFDTFISKLFSHQYNNNKAYIIILVSKFERAWQHFCTTNLNHKMAKWFQLLYNVKTVKKYMYIVHIVYIIQNKFRWSFY